MKISDYEKQVEGLNCRWCGTHLPSIIKSYDHNGGHEVEGFQKNQWLYVTCGKCDYDWSLSKLLAQKERKQATLVGGRDD